MPKYPKNYKDIEYYVPNRKRPIALSIKPLCELITDRSKYIFQPEAVEVVNAYIKAGYADCVPTWR